MPRGRRRAPRDGESVRVNGIPVPFTFWPDAYLQHGRLVASNPWTCMAGFAKQTIVDARKRGRIIAFLEQSEDFYRAASNPRISSKPLLYYYSYMNLVKAFLVCHNHNISRAIHGLMDPKENITKKLTITSQKVAVNNKDSGPRIQTYRTLVEECGFSVPVRPRRMKLVDLLEQVVGVHRTVCHTLRRRQRFFPIAEIAFEYDRSNKDVWVAFHVKHVELAVNQDAPREIAANMSAFEEVESPNTDFRRFESVMIKRYSRSPRDVLGALVKEVKCDIWSLLRPGGYQFFVSSIPVSIRLAQIASNYQAMFYFGSVTRYRPDDFLKLLEGKHGWLVEEFIDTQPLQFIYLLGSGLMKAEMVVTEAAT